MVIGIDARVLVEGFGGVFVYAKNVLKHIVRQAPQHQFKLFVNNYKKSPQHIIEELLQYPNVKLYQYKFPSKFLNASLKFKKWPNIDDLVKGCDVLFFPSMMYCAWSKKTKTVLTMHDLSFEIYPEFFTSRQQIWQNLVRPKELTNRVDSVIAVSNSTKKDLLSLYNIPQENISTIYSGVDTKFRPVVSRIELEHIRTKYGLPDKRFILQTGTLEPRKNHIATLDSFELLHKKYPQDMKNTHLLFIGHNGWKSNKLLSKVRKSRVSDIIYILNDVPISDFPALYSLADVFVYPSFYEGFGFPILEAFSCKVPVISSNTSSLGEIVQDSGLLINPYQINELVTTLHILLKDKGLVKSFQAKGLRRTVNFSWEKTALETLKVLETVIYEHRN